MCRMVDFRINFEEQLEILIKNNDWKTVLHLGSELDHKEKTRYLWSWPDEEDLQVFKNIALELNWNTVLSVGCGSGLLEWIISNSTGVHFAGIERDEFWWSCKFSPKKCMKMNYINESTKISQDFLTNCCDGDKFVLFFCYFNNKNAFLEYLHEYEKFGDFLIVIGPGKAKTEFIVTTPAPFDLGFEVTNWSLYKYFKFGKENDCMAIYSKKLI